MKSVSLSYRDDRSDKVYRVELVPSGEGFVVNFAYGRRGSAHPWWQPLLRSHQHHHSGEDHHGLLLGRGSEKQSW